MMNRTTFGTWIAAWFWLAPDPRFLGASLWICATGLLVVATTARDGGAALTAIRTLAIAIVATFICFSFYMGWKLNGIILQPGPRDGGYPISRIATKTFLTRSKLALQVPVKGDMCWEAPLPCTPYPAPRLMLREPEDLGSGFQLEPDDSR